MATRPKASQNYRIGTMVAASRQLADQSIAEIEGKTGRRHRLGTFVRRIRSERHLVQSCLWRRPVPVPCGAEAKIPELTMLR